MSKSDERVIDEIDIAALILYAEDIEYAQELRTLRGVMFALNQDKKLRPDDSVGSFRMTLITYLAVSKIDAEKEKAIVAKNALEQLIDAGKTSRSNSVHELDRFLKSELLEFSPIFEKRKQLRTEGAK